MRFCADAEMPKLGVGRERMCGSAPSSQRLAWWGLRLYDWAAVRLGKNDTYGRPLSSFLTQRKEAIERLIAVKPDQVVFVNPG
jgi:hypothetical protein